MLNEFERWDGMLCGCSGFGTVTKADESKRCHKMLYREQVCGLLLAFGHTTQVNFACWILV